MSHSTTFLPNNRVATHIAARSHLCLLEATRRLPPPLLPTPSFSRQGQKQKRGRGGPCGCGSTPGGRPRKRRTSPSPSQGPSPPPHQETCTRCGFRSASPPCRIDGTSPDSDGPCPGCHPQHVSSNITPSICTRAQNITPTCILEHKISPQHAKSSYWVQMIRFQTVTSRNFISSVPCKCSCLPSSNHTCKLYKSQCSSRIPSSMKFDLKIIASGEVPPSFLSSPRPKSHKQPPPPRGGDLKDSAARLL